MVYICCIMIGIPFLITNFRKGGFLALFHDRSGAVRQYGILCARKKSSKNTLFSVLRIFADKKSPLAVRFLQGKRPK